METRHLVSYQQWTGLKIAQPFMAGWVVRKGHQSRQGRQKNVVAVRKDLSSLPGLGKMGWRYSQP
jgi:hypothetical protein